MKMGVPLRRCPLSYGVLMEKELYGIPAETWYALMVAADVDGAWGREEPGRVCDLLEEVFLCGMVEPIVAQ